MSPLLCAEYGALTTVSLMAQMCLIKKLVKKNVKKTENELCKDWSILVDFKEIQKIAENR